MEYPSRLRAALAGIGALGALVCCERGERRAVPQKDQLKSLTTLAIPSGSAASTSPLRSSRQRPGRWVEATRLARRQLEPRIADLKRSAPDRTIEVELGWFGENEPKACWQTAKDCLWIIQAMVVSRTKDGAFQEPWLTVGVSQTTGTVEVREQPPDEWLF